MSASRAAEEVFLYLYVTASYLTQISNELSVVVGPLASAQTRIQLQVEHELILKAAVRVLNIQIASFGVFELPASRYKALCGLHGVAGVADLEIIAAYIDPLVAFSSYWRETRLPKADAAHSIRRTSRRTPDPRQPSAPQS